MNRQSFVALFVVAMLGFGLLAAGCPPSDPSPSSNGGGGLVCNNGCYCPAGCGQLYKCSGGSCFDTFCCCTGGGCGRCGCS